MITPLFTYLLSGHILGLYMREDGLLFACWREVGKVGTIWVREVKPENFWKFVNENRDKEFCGKTL